METPTPPPSCPEPPTTLVKASGVQSMPSTPRTASLSSATCTRYVVNSPTKTGTTVSWFEAGALTQGVAGASVHSTSKHRSGTRRKAPAAAYVVFFGAEISVFHSWSDVQCSITGHGVAIHCGFPTVTVAQAALDYARAQGWTADSSPLPGGSRPTSYDKNPLNTGSSAASCLNTIGVKGNLSNTFGSHVEAEKVFNEASTAGWVRAIPRQTPL
ncbi:hypothetical protein B0H17DRAFT_1199498 [Mycena rosella]|uniref:Ribonuclease H1 N-terminal domain-containing protein n=1 Tax=Mycena rosella TaxID=1033263 RepID=A0AAD7GJW7_MYCRO|nr:hypothetical protein B0H17DRAFT_1199498 [Mycena rosella]